MATLSSMDEPLSHQHALPSAADPVDAGPALQWQQVLAREPSANFVYAVRTTGIFCRTTCPSRRPAQSNVLFFPSAAAALDAGFRPCLRCRPASQPAEALAVERVGRLPRDAARPLLRLARRACPPHRLRPGHRPAALHPRHGHEPARLGQRRRSRPTAPCCTIPMGASPTPSTPPASPAPPAPTPPRPSAWPPVATRRKAQASRSATPSRPHPCQPPSQAAAPCLAKSSSPPPSAASALFYWASTTPRLSPSWPTASPARHSLPIPRSYLGSPPCSQPLASTPAPQALPLDLRGTTFQIRVWEALRAIPRGQTRSYTELATLGRRSPGRPRGRRRLRPEPRRAPRTLPPRHRLQRPAHRLPLGA